LKIPRAFYEITPSIRQKIKNAIKNIVVAGGNPTVQRVRKAGADVNQVNLADCVRWYKQGNLPPLDETWQETRKPAVDLQATIDAATTIEDLGNLSKLVMKQILDGTLSSQQGTAVKGLLLEARQALKQSEDKEPPEVDDAFIPVSEEAAEIARQFEGIIDEESRQAITDLVQELYTKDLTVNQNFDGAKQ